MSEEDLGVVLSWSGESYVSDMADPNDLIYEVSGDILDIEDEILVGKFRLYYVDVERALKEEIRVFDVLDSHAHTVEYFEAIFGDCESEQKWWSDDTPFLVRSAAWPFSWKDRQEAR